MAGDGEVFASEAYRTVYRSDAMKYPKFIRILSNGTLFNEKNWIDFKAKVQGKVLATFSIDAASKETYEKLLKQADFLLFPSRVVESFGLSALEALQYDVPVIGFKK